MGALTAAALLWLVHSALAPAFAGARPVTRARAANVARAALESCEIFVTNPSVGARTRMQVKSSTTVSSVIEDARKLLGFDQDFIASSDFNLYVKGDEDGGSPLTGTQTLGELGLIQ